MIVLLFLFLFLLPYNVKTHELEKHPQWLNLVHYKKSFWGGYKSEADGQAFFLSPNGKTNPAAELKATRQAFLNPDHSNPTQCKFPARFLWLKQISENNFKTLSCKNFEEFKKRVAAKSATLVFSAYYLNNPASTFGHTLLRLNKAEKASGERRFELLDYGINYAAVVTTENPILYALFGLIGVFQGTFTSIPYYYKVREYNDYESRDLWEYDLNLTPEQIELLVAHLWELGSTHFDYYYFTENCSYHILALLDAANPNLKLVERTPSIVIPSDTVKVLMDTPGLVEKVHYRPSVRVQFHERSKRLSSEQVSATKKILDSLDKEKITPPENLTQKQNLEREHVEHPTEALARGNDASRSNLDATKYIEALDTAIDYVDFKYNRELYKPESVPSQWKQKLLLARSQVPIPSEVLKVPVPQNETPHLGHGSFRMGLEYGYGIKTSHHARYQLRYALHDLLDPVMGYPSTAQIEFFNLTLRYNFVAKSFWVEDFSLIHVISLSPLSAFIKTLSWKVKFGAKTIRDSTCDGCLAGNFLLGGGYTLEPLTLLRSTEPLTLSPAPSALETQASPNSQVVRSANPFLNVRYYIIGMLEFEELGSPRFEPFFLRTAVGPTLSFRFLFTPYWNGMIFGSYKYQFPSFLNHTFFYGAEIRFSFHHILSALHFPNPHGFLSDLHHANPPENLALNFKFSKNPIEQEYGLGFFYYF